MECPWLAWSSDHIPNNLCSISIFTFPLRYLLLTRHCEPCQAKPHKTKLKVWFTSAIRKPHLCSTLSPQLYVPVKVPLAGFLPSPSKPSVFSPPFPLFSLLSHQLHLLLSFRTIPIPLPSVIGPSYNRRRLWYTSGFISSYLCPS